MLDDLIISPGFCPLCGDPWEVCEMYGTCEEDLDQPTPWCYECDEPQSSCVCNDLFDPDDLPPEAFAEYLLERPETLDAETRQE